MLNRPAIVHGVSGVRRVCCF